MRKNMVLKFVAIGIISVVLLITLSSIKGLTSERAARLREVQEDIASSYAGVQRIAGPICAVAYRESWAERTYNEEKDSWYDKECSELRTEWIFPERIDYVGEMNVQERTRGIFKARVFKTEGTLSGAVSFPEVESLGFREGSAIEIVSANACLLLSDRRGFTQSPVFKWNGGTLEVEHDSDLDIVGSGVHVKLPERELLFGRRFEFSVGLNVRGSGELTFVPVGNENHARLSSEWPHPSFMGDFLATDRHVTADGFSAEWDVNGLASTAQTHITRVMRGPVQRFGVQLVDPVNVYSMTDRALKYGFLFIFITFAAFYLYETLAQARIHPVQYGFVGFAQAIFFLLLLSLSEHVNFGLSYFIASLATVGLITFYVRHVLSGAGHGLVFGGLLALLYGVLYALLRSEDHALVAGSVLIFGLMTLAMLLTRKIDWYALGAKSAEGAR